MIRLVICDGDGTLELPNPSDGVRRLLGTMGEMGICLAVVSNAPRRLVEARFENAGIPVPEIIVTPRETGKQKPAADFVLAAVEEAGVLRRETIYLGDDDLTDMLCAVNGHVLPMAAVYSASTGVMEYGLPVPSAKHLEDYLRTYGSQGDPYFGWVLDEPCPDTGEPVRVRVLLGDHVEHTEELKRVLKDREDVPLKGNSLKTLLFHYLLSQCYLSGLTEDVDVWTVYPGHRAGTTNPLLAEFCRTASRTFRDSPLNDLLVRHKDAPESKRVAVRDIADQLSTIRVNPAHRSRIRGRRVLVLDDFTTSGHSLEAGRRMLLKAGAGEVVCVAFGKYRRTHDVVQIGVEWDPFGGARFRKKDLIVTSRAGEFHREADEHFWRVIYPAFGG